MGFPFPLGVTLDISFSLMAGIGIFLWHKNVKGFPLRKRFTLLSNIILSWLIFDGVSSSFRCHI